MKTAILTPLEVTRAKWATIPNAEKHYDVLAGVLLQAVVAVENPAYKKDVPYSERLLITKPERIFSLDETRLTNDTTDKCKSKSSRGLVGKGKSREVLVNKGGGDGT